MPANWLPVHRKIKEKLKSHNELMLVGGAGSSKTWTHLHTICSRCLLLPGSRHLAVRKRFEHAKVSTWNSLKEMMNAEWPGLYEKCTTNKSGGSWILYFPNGSEVHVGGLDDKQRIEKWLGSEWATIYINEASEVEEERDVDLIASRLRQKIDGRHLLLLDENPPPKTHWSYRRYIKDEGKVDGRAFFKINPIDVKENLPASYIERLQNLPPHLKERFWHGNFRDANPNAIFREDWFDTWRVIEGQDMPEMQRVIVGVDPSGADDDSTEADAVGIYVAGLGLDGNAYLIEDCTVKAGPAVWGKMAVSAYHRHKADLVVGEQNFGGAMVKFVIKSAGKDVNYKLVTASRGKVQRAEPFAQLFQDGRIRIVGRQENLEQELSGFSTNGYTGARSPNVADAAFWALAELFPGVVGQRLEKVDPVIPIPVFNKW